MKIRKRLALALSMYLGIAILAANAYDTPFAREKRLGEIGTEIHKYIIADMNRDGKKDIVSLETSINSDEKSAVIKIFFNKGGAPCRAFALFDADILRG